MFYVNDLCSAEALSFNAGLLKTMTIVYTVYIEHLLERIIFYIVWDFDYPDFVQNQST